ncbi:MAG: ribosome maturation factor RimP [Candidatus Omnitrophica bacterium]|nr:ribosome maturation factor RimP [Candidatus Omnitrophota bacterium]
MDRQAVAAELEGLLGDYLRGEGIDLVEIIHRYEGRDLVLRLLVDRPEGGISLGECARLNIGISRILDEKNFLDMRYVLEVSSPGLDRLLKTKRDFARCINKKARFFLNTPINGKIEWDGIITRIDEDTLYIDIEGSLLGIPLASINQAKQIIE